jgi:hypothetical protein
MSMNRKTLIAGGVFVVLAAIAFFVLRAPEKGVRTGDAPRPIAKIGAGEIDTLEVTKDGKTTVIKKEGSTYKVAAPTAYAADQDGAKQAFEAIEKLDFTSIVSDQKAKQDEYEVGAKGLRVVAKKSDGKGDKTLADLRIGKVLSSTTAVRPEGSDQIWQAAGSLKFTFDKDAAGWRDKSILTFEEGDAERLEVVSKTGGKIALKRPAKGDAGAAGAGGEWTVVESTVKVDPLDTGVAPGMISALSSFKANDFADGASAGETGLDAPSLTVTVGLKGGKTHTIQIGNKKGEEDFYVKAGDRPQVFLVKKYNLDRVNKRPVEFRDKTICNLNEGDVTEVAVVRSKDPFTLVKDPKKSGDDAWKLSKPAGVALETSKVGSILAGFKDWKATTFSEESSAKAMGLDKPTATVNARTNVKGSACVVKIGAETADKQGYYVERSGSADVFVAPKWSVDRVLQKLDDLKKKSGT